MGQHAIEIIAIAERPELSPIVARWLWETFAFWKRNGHTVDGVRDVVSAAISPSGPPQTFVLLVDHEPVGTASLAANDLDSRPDLTPWLAGVFVDPAHRGHGYVAHLIAAVEAACTRAAIRRLWLYTRTAEHVYARAGWRTVEHFDREGRRYALMCRDL